MRYPPRIKSGQAFQKIVSRACPVASESGHALESLIGACSYRRTGTHPGSSPGQAFAGTCAGPGREGRKTSPTSGRYAVSTYIVLINWTEKGVQQVKESPKRFEAGKKVLKDMGGDIKQIYLTMGDYDLVAICDAPDDAVMARFLMQLGMLGNVRTRTLKAFP